MISTATMLDAALDYAGLIGQYFRAIPAPSQPLLPRGRDAEGLQIKNSSGVKKASTNPEQIQE